MNGNAFVSAGTKGSCVLRFSAGTLTAIRYVRTDRFSTSYYRERRICALPPALTSILFEKELSVRMVRCACIMFKITEINCK